ncbi:hypothetical protein [Thermus amyloliquefaciens]|uniref:hypothetical protein n=1 Tax=Thermus amyloliquefaciens TaxID=1449080 RepID=UPI00057028C4|nr:hypothetical protein [Thermus amyloliquefaciens]
MRKLVGLGLLVSLAVLFSACGKLVFDYPGYPTELPVLYYPQNPSLCPGGAGAVSTNNPRFYSLPLKPTTSPPTPPGPGEIIPFPADIGPVTGLPFYMGDSAEKYDLTFYCNAGEGRHLTTPGPRWPPRDYFVVKDKIPVLVVVEDVGQPGYLRWYWAYLE